MGGTKLKPCPFCGGTNAATRCSRRGEYGETLYPFYFVRYCSCRGQGADSRRVPIPRLGG